ncbi:Variant-specific surface protein [Giardia duodenalis]|uniref:Variant-specific surface protein n=1 Tax=Giardia intestinalis TaxID=5741 RepID=V6TQA2_GIAIN|nr:Variant-specific surface protein [Giardia intestinalis]
MGCSVCEEGYYLDNADRTCKVCTGCATYETSATQCTSCSRSKYLKEDTHTCVDANQCGASNYADKRTWTCKACSEIAGCTACAYNDNLGGPVCSTCSGSNMVKTEIDGTATCVAETQCAVTSQPGTHLLNKGNDGCIVCSNAGDTTPGNQGVANCKTCTKAASGSNPTCSECLDGYFFTSSSNTCATKCDQSCRTCSEAVNANKCESCYPGYFLVTESADKKCVPCGNTAQGGIDGCAECTNAGTFKCTKCKPNRKPVGTEGTQVTCEEKTCEDETACGGTAGACGAIVIGASGEMTYYCSYCGEFTKFPIDGICTDQQQQNTCAGGACQSCAANYFLYMGGCYSSTSAPGNLMCKTAAGGICTITTSQYFKVPGAAANQQSVLACENPLGTTVDGNAYVGIQGCKTCEAPTAATGMASVKCTACDEGTALTGSGYGCVTCSIAGCSKCKADNMCEACGDGYRLEGEACVSTGPNLGTGAMAGISVTKSLSALCC